MMSSGSSGIRLEKEQLLYTLVVYNLKKEEVNQASKIYSDIRKEAIELLYGNCNI